MALINQSQSDAKFVTEEEEKKEKEKKEWLQFKTGIRLDTKAKLNSLINLLPLVSVTSQHTVNKYILIIPHLSPFSFPGHKFIAMEDFSYGNVIIRKFV